MKELEDEEKRKKFVDARALEKAEREKEKAKKNNLLREQLNDLNLLNKKRELENQERKEDEENIIKNRRDPFRRQYLTFKDNLAKKNNRIFGNSSKYNTVLVSLLDPNIFNAKNDTEFNKLLADAKEKERNKIDPTELEQAFKNLVEWNKGLKSKKKIIKTGKNYIKNI